MFRKGDKIVYPMYGAGIIEDLEEQDIDGISQLYYVLGIPIGNLKIKISAGKAEHLGIREIYCMDDIISIMKSVIPKPIEMPDNWNQRYKENLEKIKSGSLFEVALVYRNLLLRERQRGLSSAEKKLLTTAKQIITSEIILSQDIDKASAEEILLSTFSDYNEIKEAK